MLIQWITVPLLTPFAVPLGEMGKRQSFHATSARFSRGKSAEGAAEARRAKGEGAYLLRCHWEVGLGRCVWGYREREREREMGERDWEHKLEVFEDVQGKIR